MKTRKDFLFILDCMKEVFLELGEKEASDLLVSLKSEERKSTKTLNLKSEKLAQVLSLYFQLLNITEENAAAQYRRQAENQSGAKTLKGSWMEKLTDLMEKGFTEKQIADSLMQVYAEPVLTAHPTEAKRITVLEQHRTLYLNLLKLENTMWTESEKDAVRDEIKLSLERLWRTGEIYLQKPDVISERNNILHYLENVFPNILTGLDNKLKQAWKSLGYNSDLIKNYDNFPVIRFGNWVGGDRDGHPFVTSSVTEDTLKTFRTSAVGIITRELIKLTKNLSLSDRLQKPPLWFNEKIESLAVQLGKTGEECLNRNHDEPWRQYLNLLICRLPKENNSDSYEYSKPEELLKDLDYLVQSLREIKADRFAELDVIPVQRIIQTFGFHLASLDIRQNSKYHDSAFEQILQAAGFEDFHFSAWTEEKRLSFIRDELKSMRPFLSDSVQCGKEADDLLSYFRIIKKYAALNGFDCIGAIIVSMTRSLSDLLLVYLFAREVGLLYRDTDSGNVYCPLSIVPLFETIEDLQQSPEIFEAYVQNPVVKESLYSKNKNASRPCIQIMLGYSDSNKDGGILASQWNLYLGQKNLTEAANKQNMDIMFFHGRGGTISRGGGKTHKFMQALPHFSFSGRIRMTVQGEVISQQFANWNTAVYNLELLLASSASTFLKHKFTDKKLHQSEALLDSVSRRSKEVYRSLITDQDFMEFYSMATPIDVIENSRHGSRPARRTGKRSLGDLRAIPWVFSWNQSRFYLPGWYGIGSALEELKEGDPDGFSTLKADLKEWNFLKYVMGNAELNLVFADPEIMKLYSSLVSNDSIRERILNLILKEYEKTSRMIEELSNSRVGEMKPQLRDSFLIRKNGLHLLHEEQVELLGQWRRFLSENKTEEAENTLLNLLLTVNAIASGLRTTG